MKALLLAAGLGTRLRPVTDKFAKPTVPFLNVPLAFYAVQVLEDMGATSFVLNAHYKPEQIEKLARHLSAATGAAAVVSHEPGAQPLGSGGGLWHARRHFQDEENFLIANGDEVILPDAPGFLASCVERHRREKNLASLVVMRHPLVGSQFGGVWCNATGDVLGFGKDTRQFAEIEAAAAPTALTGFHYIGLLILHKTMFSYLPEGESNILYDALTRAIAAGERVRAFCGEFTWYETGNSDDFLRASGEALKLLATAASPATATEPAALYLQKFLRRHLTDAARPRQTLNGGVVFDQNSTRCDQAAAGRAANFTLNGFAVLAENVVIGEGALLENVVALPGAIVAPGVVVKNQIVF